uniref:Glycoprotein-N-acetylgalactosamine 3-beta-galactosyltransferase 1 n=1 Tax=Timema bartmani TaxID=61472 RepID=A0A7R9EZT4_9NEOP|nr:unnamed protein product [Timema bartmani]
MMKLVVGQTLVLTLCVGILFGFTFGYLLLVTTHYSVKNIKWNLPSHADYMRSGQFRNQLPHARHRSLSSPDNWALASFPWWEKLAPPSVSVGLSLVGDGGGIHSHTYDLESDLAALQVKPSGRCQGAPQVEALCQDHRTRNIPQAGVRSLLFHPCQGSHHEAFARCEKHLLATLHASPKEDIFTTGIRQVRLAQPYDPHHHSDLENVENIPVGSMGEHSSDEEFHKDEDLVAREMAQKVRVLCWIMTNPKNHKKKARHVKATWGRRCNIVLFMSSINDTSLPTVALPVKEGRDHLWAKTKEAFKYVYKHYLDQADFFMKADDDTYVVVENLRFMLSIYDPLLPLFFGCRFKPFVKHGYMSGGAGYVLSKAAVTLFVEKALPDKRCRQNHGGCEDIEIGTL